jgi:hypothetical protein
MLDTVHKKIENLDNKITELQIELYRVKCFLDIYKIIGLNYKEIKAIGWGQSFFWQVQQMSLDSYVLGICKVFEKEKKYELNSLPGIIKAAKEFKPQDERPLMDLVSKHRDLLVQRKENCGSPSLAGIEKIYKEFYKKYFIEDDRLVKVRDKIVAHPEYIEDVMKPKNLPSYDMMEKILFFAIDMHSAISNAFLIVAPHPIKNDKRVFSSTHTILETLGISSVKTKFDDE